jgi:hypothetical protein
MYTSMEPGGGSTMRQSETTSSAHRTRRCTTGVGFPSCPMHVVVGSVWRCMAADHGPRVGGGDRPCRAVRCLSAGDAASGASQLAAPGQDKLCLSNMATKIRRCAVISPQSDGKMVLRTPPHRVFSGPGCGGRGVRCCASRSCCSLATSTSHRCVLVLCLSRGAQTRHKFFFHFSRRCPRCVFLALTLEHGSRKPATASPDGACT